MTDKEFRRLSRADLIEIIYELQKSEKALQEENEALRQKLEERRVTVSEADSLAEVLKKLNGLLETAQAASDDYREQAERMLEEFRQTRAETENYAANMREQFARMTRLTMMQRESMLEETEEECRKLRAAAREGSYPPEQNADKPDTDDTSPTYTGGLAE